MEIRGARFSAHFLAVCATTMPRKSVKYYSNHIGDVSHDTWQFEKAAKFWDREDPHPMPEAELKQAVSDYIQANNTCTLATGTGEYVRCTPIEYSFHDGKFWLFSEGGKKFIGLEHNPNVSLAISDKYDSFGSLKSLQVMGKAELIEPFSDTYNAHAAYKKIPLAVLKRLATPMNLICTTPTEINALFSDFKNEGYNVRQTLML